MTYIHWLTFKPFVVLLLITNVLGTIYGYYWYGEQLAVTPWYFLPFVPDSPTATLFLCGFLWTLLRRTRWPIIEALALVTLFKYGIWAVVMNGLVMWQLGELDGIALMLTASHFAMAVQGVLYVTHYSFKWSHLVIAAIWTIHNDFIDYVYEMMPNYYMLADYMNEIGYFTFWLSLVSIALGAWSIRLRQQKKLAR